MAGERRSAWGTGSRTRRRPADSASLAGTVVTVNVPVQPAGLRVSHGAGRAVRLSLPGTCCSGRPLICHAGAIGAVMKVWEPVA
jgi:hypothetical protein